MANSNKLQFVLGLVGRVTGPLKKVRRDVALFQKHVSAGATILNKRFGDMEMPDIVKPQTQVMKDFGISAKTAGDMVGFLAAQGGDLKGELLKCS